jgi:hypothetical protein
MNSAKGIGASHDDAELMPFPWNHGETAGI